MAELLIAAQNIVTATPDAAALSPGYVLIEDGRIIAVEAGDPPRPPDERLDRGVLVPGFVDIQVNGYYGVEFDVADEAGWRLVTDRLPETGTTSTSARKHASSARAPRRLKSPSPSRSSDAPRPSRVPSRSV